MKTKTFRLCIFTLSLIVFVALSLKRIDALSASVAPVEASTLRSYGNEGFVIVGDKTSLPPAVTFSAIGTAVYVYAESTTEERALQRADTDARVAATWYSPTSSYLALQLNLADGKEHHVSLYMYDWDQHTSREQRIDVTDTNSGAVLDTQTIKDFHGGVYLTWRIRGNVTFLVTERSGDAVISGVFIDPVTMPTPTPTPTPSPTTTPTPTPTATPTPPAVCQTRLPNGKCKKGCVCQ